MKVIILAAGVGDRLGNESGGRPKCLLEFGGASLIARHLRVLGAQSVGEVNVVTGFRADLIQDELARLSPHVPAKTIFNPDFRLGSVVSLWSARTVLTSNDSILLMDADVLYHATILQALIDTPHPSCFLLDRNFEGGEEPVKLCIRSGQIVEFRKTIASGLACDFQGESVGFFRFAPETAAALAARTADYIASGRKDAPYEEAIRDLVLEAPERFGYEEVTGIPWIEIDFPQDVARARQEVLKKIEVEI